MADDEKLPVHIITPEPGFHAIGNVFRELVQDFPMARELAWRMFLRDTRSQFRQSFLGYFWLFIPPLATTMVWVFLNSQKVLSIDSGNTPYPLFVLTGNVLWGTFNISVMITLASVNEARSMLSKIRFPHESLLMTAFAKSFLQGGVQLILLIPAFFIFGVAPVLTWLLLPIGFGALLLFGTAFSLLLLPVATLVADVGRGIQLLLRFWFFLTPVIYALPEEGLARTVTFLNPVTPLLVSTRSWLIGGEVVLPGGFLLVSFCSLLFLFFGLLFFKLAMPRLIERMAA